VVAGGGSNLTPAQRALLGPGEVASRLPRAHAGVTALTMHGKLGSSRMGRADSKRLIGTFANLDEAFRNATANAHVVWRTAKP
jgi:hypothetical protein